MASEGFNNFKGVMICTRPGENPGPVKKDIFCARVVPAEQLGLVPTKKYDEIKVRKRKNPVLNKHKAWLEQFKARIASEKQYEEEAFIRQQQRQQKIRENADKQRERIRMGNSAISAGANESLQKSSEAPKVQAKHHSKHNEKPAWAQTQAQAEKKQQTEQEELLDFFNNTDIDKYMEDVEVKALLNTLKGKIDDIKKDKDWKENNKARLKAQAKTKQQQEQNDDDKKTEVSKGSVSKSVASEKTSQRIQQLRKIQEKKQKQQADWDKHTKTSKQSYANIEQRIAKNVADDLLRNYNNLKAVHSNVSVRKLLEREAARQLAETELAHVEEQH